MRLKFCWLLTLSIVPRDIYILMTVPLNRVMALVNESANETGFPTSWSPKMYLADILVNSFAVDGTGQSIATVYVCPLILSRTALLVSSYS